MNAFFCCGQTLLGPSDTLNDEEALPGCGKPYGGSQPVRVESASQGDEESTYNLIVKVLTSRWDSRSVKQSSAGVIEMAGARSEAVAVFRSLLRTRRQCFAGDPDMLTASAKQIREEFEANRNVGPGEELDNLISKAREGIEFMRVNIVQAKLNERGNYEMKLKQEHEGGELEPV